MNVGSLQAFLGSVGQSAGNNSNSPNSIGDSGFGSVLNSMMASGTNSIKPVDNGLSDSVVNKSIIALLNATTVEEIADILSPLVVKETNLGFSEISQLDIDEEQAIHNILKLLEQVGLHEDQLEATKYATDIWSYLNVIDQVAPKFFAEVTAALEGKGNIPKEEALQLFALLKSVSIEAPKTDLIVKQEQQVFSLQGFLAVVSEKLENTLKSNPNRQNVIQLMEAQYALRITPQAQAGQNATNEDSLKESPKETIQQPVIAATQPNTIREEIRLAQPENTSNARNEALMREMQNIFKRSNFGQTGGTNRLLIKLYPEHLGQVRIELVQNNGIMSARILASSALGKEMLDSQLHQLRAAFAQQNLQVDRIDISQTLQDASRNERDNAFNQHFKKEQEQPELQQDENTEEEMTFEEYMIELEA